MNLINNSRVTFYYLGLLLVTISSSLIGRTYLFQIPYLNPALKYGAIVFFLLSFISKRWHKSDLFKSILMIIAVSAVAIITDSNTLLIYILAIVVSRPGDFDRICRFLFWTNLIILFSVFGLCAIGILQDEVTIHSGLSAHSLGYAYYSSPAYTVLFLTVLGYYLYSGKKHTQRRIGFFLLSAFANYAIYKITTVRLTFYIYIILLVLIIVYDYTGFIQKLRINRLIATAMYPVMFLLSIILPFIYTRNNFLVQMDTYLNGRFYFSMMGFARYKVNLFGNQIITDSGGFDEKWHNTYFYIDSGYVKLLLGYGIILCTVVLFVYIMVSRYAAEKKNTKLFIWCIMVCIFSFINDPLTDIILNPLLFITIQLFSEIRNERNLARITGKKIRRKIPRLKF